MNLIIAKDALPKFEKDLEVSVKTIKAIEEVLRLNHLGKDVTSLNLKIKTGLEHMLFYDHVKNLEELSKNIKNNVPKEIPQSVHSPYNLFEPNKADVSLEEGRKMIKEIIDFASEIGGKVVNAHPNIIVHTQEELRVFPHQDRFNQLIEGAKELSKYAEKRNLKFAIENILFPSTDQDKPDLIYNLGYITLDEGLMLAKNGILLTEDNCHRRISSATINKAISEKETSGKSLDEITKKMSIHGLPCHYYKRQPSQIQVANILKKNIIHLHLNDGKPYNPSNLQAEDPKNTAVLLEALNIGDGTLCDYSDFFPAIEYHAKTSDLKEMFVVIEVYEKFSPENGGNPYRTHLNYSVDAIRFYKALLSNF